MLGYPPPPPPPPPPCALGPVGDREMGWGAGGMGLRAIAGEVTPQPPPLATLIVMLTDSY